MIVFSMLPLSSGSGVTRSELKGRYQSFDVMSSFIWVFIMFLIKYHMAVLLVVGQCCNF